MRKACRRRPLQPRPPRGLEPKLTRGQQTDLSLAHLVNLDLVATGQADESLLWQLVECALTWSYVADELGLHVEAMREQLLVVASLLNRYRRTGKVGFSGLEYQQAKEGVEVMDELAAKVDKATAVQACAWSDAMVELVVQQAAQMETAVANKGAIHA